MPSNLSFSDSTADFYSAIHAEIAKVPEASPALVEFKLWLKEASPSGSALDAGCGTHALNARACLAAGLDASAVDINPDAVRNGQDIGVRPGSVLDLPFPDASFDLVISTGVVHHTPAPQRGLAELHRVTKPGGRAYISLYTFRFSAFDLAVRCLRLVGRLIPFATAHRIAKGSPALNNFVLDHMYVPVLWLYTGSEARRAIEATGFVVEREWPSALDPFARVPLLGRLVSGAGLLRVFICRRPG